jgi:PAS domain S-box-containing protein
LDALTKEAAIYPDTQISIFLNEYEDEERFIVAHRVTSFGIEMQSLIAQGTRFPASQFHLITKSSDEGLFVSPNFPADERIDTRTRQMVEQMGTVSMAIVPIRSGEKAFGSIVVASPAEGFFDERRLHLYQTLAEQGATALRLAALNEEIQENEQQFRSIVEHAHAGILIADDSFHFTYVNDRLAEISGYTVDELVGMDFRNVIAEESLEMVADYYTRRQRGEDIPSTYELTIVRKDGEHRIGEMTVSLLSDTEHGSQTLAQFLDVTERKQAQAERERFTLQLRTASEIAGQIAAILDPQNLLTAIISQLKERFGLYHAHYYNLDSDENVLRLSAGYGEVGQQMLEDGHAIPFDREQSLVARAARTGDAVVIGDVTQASDFLPNPLLPLTRSEVAVPVVSGDRVLGVFDVQQDARNHFTEGDVRVFTTLAGQIATALENARLFEQVQEADKLKSEFLANMSHELRTPLNSILGYSEIMLMGLDEGISPDTMEDVQAIYDNGQHLLRLINDVLDLAKIEAGRMSLEVEDVDIGPILDEVLRSNAGLLINKPLEISTETEADLPTIKADRVRLSQIFNNLFSNAVKFTDEGGIRLHAFRENGWCVIEVADTGIGMSEEDLEVIFERFRQVDGSAARMKDGSGLGLAITSHLIKMHNGTIDVKSELGKGSTFTVRLPAASQT